MTIKREPSGGNVMTADTEKKIRCKGCRWHNLEVYRRGEQKPDPFAACAGIEGKHRCEARGVRE